ncbi:Fc.00g050990.m01.CDS01 [Cosmosporella sp. VM-42]
MHFAKALMTLVASVATAAAGTVTFRTLDSHGRTLHFTPNEGFPKIASVQVSNAEETTVTFPEPWIGNFYAIKEGEPNNAGMLGEVNFGGWLGKTYFDVSAIVDPSDHDNVKQMWPVSSKLPTSGCEVFPCDNCYWLPDDIQTKVTDETDLITTLGSPSK